MSQHVQYQGSGTVSPKSKAAIINVSNYTYLSCCDTSKCPFFPSSAQGSCRFTSEVEKQPMVFGVILLLFPVECSLFCFVFFFCFYKIHIYIYETVWLMVTFSCLSFSASLRVRSSPAYINKPCNVLCYTVMTDGKVLDIICLID